MVRYLIRRLLWAVVLFLSVTMVTYMIFFVIPANPAQLACGQRATPDCIRNAEVRLGLDRPVAVQYGMFLRRLVIDRSLGRSFTNRQDINETILEAAPVTASLVIGGAILWMLVALPIGILSALRPRSSLDRTATVFVLLGISLPVVWIGLVLQYIVGYRLGWTPNSGYCDFFDPPDYASCGGPADWAYHLLLPWLTFALLFAAIYVRMIRANVMDTLGEDYVRTARAKGAPESRVMRSHVLRNALLPVVTMLGMDIGIALGGAIFTEAIFGLPGLGRLAVQSLNTFDLPMIQGTIVFATLCIIVFNVIVDVAYAFIDPRIRLD
ncbi:MAG: ABC transporter permease [Thermoleophilia bacterium]